MERRVCCLPLAGPVLVGVAGTADCGRLVGLGLGRCRDADEGFVLDRGEGPRRALPPAAVIARRPGSPGLWGSTKTKALPQCGATR